ncbi:uracil-DNA glycosylase [Mycoplasmopsis mustelae]|uniref:Uracil-DNA glycosylase n=1 Tax=Mycoplasmopsis mustelae TaxID=171289 RepID=A0A4R7UBZ0_9BACT|nr:uracil-DNA glycosylase [Mycoplasmopsis mustelae]TDV23061.1 uracil-DNA glycosylase [Mycoplasmopsis mustelae]
MKDSFLKILQIEGRKPYFENILYELKNAELNKQVIYPHQLDLFRPFEFFQLQDTKVIILGQDPYYSNDFADGLAFSTRQKTTPKSLNNIFKVLLNDYPNTEIQTNSLVSWAKQGILLMNVIFSVIQGQPNSHTNIGWQAFSQAVIEEIITQNPNVILVLLGQQAQKFANKLHNIKQLNPDNIIKTSHPSPFSYQKGFHKSQLFKNINNRLKKQNQTEINWNLYKGERAW